MKKSIKAIALALLTTGMLAGCGSGGGGNPGPGPGPEEDKWGKQLEAMMEIVAGETIPFVELNADTFYSSFSATPEGGYFIVGDDNETNLLEEYGSLLTEAGYTLDAESGYYLKEDENGYSVAVDAAYYEATEDYDAGNEIYVEAMNNAVDLTAFQGDWLSKFYLAQGVDVGTIPNFEIASADELWEYNDSLFSWFGYLFASAYGVERSEIGTWKDSLLAAGWTIETEETLEESEAIDYLFTKEGTDGFDAFISTTDYLDEEEDAYLSLAFFVEEHVEKFDSFPQDDVAAFFEAQGIEGVTTADYATEAENAYFTFSDYSDDPDGAHAEVLVYNSTYEEMTAFAEALAPAWSLEADEWGDYYGYFGETLAHVAIVDWSDYYGYISIEFSVEEKPSFMTAEDAINYIADYIGGQPQEIEEGVYALYGAFSAASLSVEDMKGYVTSLFIPEEFEAQGDWTLEDDGSYYLGFVNPNMTAIESYVYAETLWVKDGTIVDEGTEGAEAVEATCLEIYAYQIPDNA